MAEKQNNAVATAGNIAHKLHGTAQIVRGAVTADFLAVASGATKVLSPKVIAGIIAAIMLIVMIPILVIFSLPQVLFNWGSLKDTELMARHEHANYLMSCYDDTDLSEEDKLWLISIDAVNNKQDIMKMSQSSISSDKMQGKTPDEVMNEYGFDDDQKNWVTLMVNTIRQAKASNNPDLPIIAGGTNNGMYSAAHHRQQALTVQALSAGYIRTAEYITCRERQRRGYITSVRGYRQAKQSREIWCFFRERTMRAKR